MNNYYKELPKKYEVYKVIDAKKKSTVIWFNIINLLMVVVAVIPFFLIFDFDFSNYLSFSLALLAGCFGFFIYIILHELTHGLVYKIFTKEKLTFGLTLSVAFCGVPHIYVSKKTALFSVLAPFVIFSIVFLLGIFLIPIDYIKFALIILFAMHFGGCVGDLYVTFILLKSKGQILMNDTGPKQTFYRYNEFLEEKEMKKENCPYCNHESGLGKFGYLAFETEVSSVIVFKDQSHPGRVIVAYKDAHVAEIKDLPKDLRDKFMDDVCNVANAIQKAYNPNRINYGAYGDTLGHLHIHLVPKYENEFEWGKTFEMNTGNLVDEAKCEEVANKIKANL